MEPTLLLLHSPFLGPAAWRSTARALRRRGRSVRLPNLTCVARGAAPFWPAGVAAVVEAAGAEPVVLVPHSNAGLYVPAVLAALGEQVRGVAFVDAAVPGHGHHTAPEFLRRLVSADGFLPPWTQWWDAADVDALFPDPRTRAEIEAEQPRMPLAYYDHLPPLFGATPPPPPCCYVWFGRPYDAGAEQAADLGWPTVRLPGQHLHMLVDPDAVAATVLELSAEWH